MRRIMLMLTLLHVCAMLHAQTTSDCDYNPYRYQREEYITTGEEMYQEFKNRPCQESLTFRLLNEYHENKDELSKTGLLYDIAQQNCDTVIFFLKELFLSDTNEKVRYDALLLLGWHRPYELVPLLLETTKQENSFSISIQIARTLCVMGEYELGISILDRICSNEDDENYRKCISIYEFAGAISLVEKYYLSEWTKVEDENDKFRIALKLAEYGYGDIAFPLIRKVLLTSTDSNTQLSALLGMAAIGTEESMSLIKDFENSSTPSVSYRAKFIPIYIEKERRRKCGK